MCSQSVRSLSGRESSDASSSSSAASRARFSGRPSSGESTDRLLPHLPVALAPPGLVSEGGVGCKESPVGWAGGESTTSAEEGLMVMVKDFSAFTKTSTPLSLPVVEGLMVTLEVSSTLSETSKPVSFSAVDGLIVIMKDILKKVGMV